MDLVIPFVAVRQPAAGQSAPGQSPSGSATASHPPPAAPDSAVAQLLMANEPLFRAVAEHLRLAPDVAAHVRMIGVPPEAVQGYEPGSAPARRPGADTERLTTALALPPTVRDPDSVQRVMQAVRDAVGTLAGKGEPAAVYGEIRAKQDHEGGAIVVHGIQPSRADAFPIEPGTIHVVSDASATADSALRATVTERLAPSLQPTQSPKSALHVPSPDTLAILSALIGFDTTSRNSNLELIQWVEAYLAQFGIRGRLTLDDTGTKANLFATIGEGLKPGIVLSGHTDVVPVDGQEWHTDPFVATVRGDRVYGRGTADMKGFIAVVLAMVPEIIAKLQDRSVHIALSYDEETGCIGVHRMIEDLKATGIQPIAGFIGEPSSMQPVVTHKGMHSLEVVLTGLAAHASLATQGVNAIEPAADLIAFIRGIGRENARSEPRQAGFEVPYTTIQTTKIDGGTATNIIPKDCRFLVDTRTLPGRSIDEIYAQIQGLADELAAEMRERAPEAGIRLSRLADVTPLQIATDHPVVQLAVDLTGNSQYTMVPFGTEAGIFNQAGIPSLVIGPGSIADAHVPDEGVDLTHLATAERFVVDLTVEQDGLAQRLGR